MRRPAGNPKSLGVAPAVGLALACAMVAMPAHAARVDVDGVASASLAAFPADLPAAIGGQERVVGMQWEQADPQTGATQRLEIEAPGCLFAGGDDPAPSSPAPGVRAGSDAFVQTQLSFEGAGHARVGSFRDEALVGEGDLAKLVVTRGFYDRLSLGLRLVDVTEIRLTVLSQSPRLYAYRDGAMLEVVMPSVGMGAIVTRDAEGRSRNFVCTHARVGVSLDSPAGTALLNGTHVREGSRRGKQAQAENLQIALSVTRTSHDPAPWVSLAIGVLR